MPKKSTKSTKSKKTPKSKAPPAPKLPSQLEREDQLLLQVAYREVESVNLRLQLTQLRLEKFQLEKKDTETRLSQLIEQANRKYQLNPDKDKMDIANGAITRGA